MAVSVWYETLDIYTHAHLQQLGLPRLELWRLHLDLLFCHRIVFGLVSVKCEDFFKPATLMTTRGHAHKLFKPRRTNTVYYNCYTTGSYDFFTEHVVDIWNNLPSMVNSATPVTFRQTMLCLNCLAL